MIHPVRNHPRLTLAATAAGCAAVVAAPLVLAQHGYITLLPGAQGTGYALLDRPPPADDPHVARPRDPAAEPGRPAATDGLRLLGVDPAGRSYLLTRGEGTVCLHVQAGGADLRVACGDRATVRERGLWVRFDQAGATWLAILTPDTLAGAEVDAGAEPAWRSSNVTLLRSEAGARERVAFHGKAGRSLVVVASEGA